ncbi:hypothetical protein SAMN05216571_101385 [Onishia taeanensis]|uniref:Uncharacterized protein n=1 Tax=Onishia taeanensis TaxID=284577 RepID=A0A1G7NFX7_9GAMM|nr:hypothetical protein [Halomonas taeanensis]SDF72219.1 hypothetical protein SAMN05216571_101385 [Halomonas taeanensis]
MPPVTEDTIDWLFDALCQLHGALWRRRASEAGWGDTIDGQFVPFDATGEWLRALQHLSVVHVRCGLETLNESAAEAVAKGVTAWPPESAMLFAKACRLRPEPLGLPSLEDAWRNLQDHVFAGQPYLHEGVEAAAQHTDLHNLRRASYWELAEHRRAFAHYYASGNAQCVVERAARGESLRPRAAIGHDSQLSPADRAARAGAERAAQQAEAAGMPHAMNAHQGLAALKAATGRA